MQSAKGVLYNYEIFFQNAAAKTGQYSLRENMSHFCFLIKRKIDYLYFKKLKIAFSFFYAVCV